MDRWVIGGARTYWLGMVWIGFCGGWALHCAPRVEVLWSTQLAGTVLQAPWPDSKGWIVGHGAGLTLLDHQGQVRCQLSNVGGVLGGAVGRGDMIYFGSNNHFVYAIDGQCQVQWRQAVGGPVAIRPTLNEDKLLVTTATGLLWSLHLATGQVDWRYPSLSKPTFLPQEPVAIDPEIQADLAQRATEMEQEGRSLEEIKVEESTQDNGRGKRQKKTKGQGKGKALGKQIEEPAYLPPTTVRSPASDGGLGAKVSPPTLASMVVGPFWSSEPISDGQMVWIGNGDGSLYGFDVAKGTLKARFRTDQGIGASPVLDGEDIFVGSYDGYIYRLRKPSLQLSWKSATDDMIVAAGWLTKEIFIIGSMDGWLRAVDRQDGQLRWRMEAGGPVASKVALRQGVLFVATASRPGRLAVLGEHDGVLRWHVPLQDGVRAPLQLQGETLLVATQSGLITAYQVGGLLRRYGRE